MEAACIIKLPGVPSCPMKVELYGGPLDGTVIDVDCPNLLIALSVMSRNADNVVETHDYYGLSHGTKAVRIQYRATTEERYGQSR